MSERIEKSWSSVLVAVRTHHKGLVGEGIVDEGRVRLTVAARVEDANQLTKPIAEGGKGLSNRQAAKMLGVAESTLRGNRAKNARKLRTRKGENGEGEDNYHKQTSVSGIQTTASSQHSGLEAEQACEPKEIYETIIIDPPWPMTKIERDIRPNQIEFDYPTMNETELREFAPLVIGMAADDCHLFMWTTQKFLPLSMQLVGLYGFKYVFTMVWHKRGGYQPTGLPQFNCEFIVYGRKGTPKFIDTKGFPCCFNAPRREHSRKPDEFYDIVSLVTAGPRIDVFSREEREGFAQFGNEASKFEAA